MPICPPVLMINHCIPPRAGALSISGRKTDRPRKCPCPKENSLVMTQFDICARRFKRMHACPRAEGSKKCNTVSRVRQNNAVHSLACKGGISRKMKIEMTVPVRERIPDAFLNAKACLGVLVRKGLRGRRIHAVKSPLVRSDRSKRKINP